ncbi:MAG: BLUF domain-containing protein [Phycisphaerales bacterium]|nr:BLUF domain-containing protein [Phycisphaerales bacterium]
MSDLYEVIYLSTRREGLTDQVIVDEIVLPSGIKNRHLDITGCLWFSNERFLQILEGPREAVEQVYEAIRSDDRHYAIATVSTSPVTHRSFARWGMRALRGDEQNQIDQLIEYHAPNYHRQPAKPTAQPDQPLIEQVRSFLVTLSQADPSPSL